MIELRWVDREVEVTAPTMHCGEPVIGAPFRKLATTERVLQYRYRYPKEEQSIRAYPPREWGWSEWVDVPHVPERD